MRIVSSEQAAEVIRSEGGRLYAWTDPHRCCSGGVTLLQTASEPRPGRRFTRFQADGFELWFDPAGRELPDELLLDVKGRRRKRVEAYWNGCAFIT
jgi:hypothetical protein